MNAMKSVDTQIKMLAQEIKTVKSNERIMGQTIVALNNKVKDIERKLGDVSTSVRPVEKESVETPIIDNTALEEIKKELEELKKGMVKKGDLDQLKYTIDLINPLLYVTASDVEDIVNRILKKREKS